MLSFDHKFDIPGMTRLDKIDVETAVPLDHIKENIIKNRDRKLPAINELSDWREQISVAIVGGGPSLEKELDNLRKFKYIMACGSVHDYLVENGITPTWCAVCDPDPIVLNYLKQIQIDTSYLIASQCAPEVFEYLGKSQGSGGWFPDVTMWHLAGDKFDASIYGKGEFALIGGGCTILTRAMVMVMGMGFYKLHMFGCDTCLGVHGEHHAYGWSDPDKERIYDETKVQFEVDGPIFKVAGYHLGQLFDYKALCKIYAGRMDVTVHGESLLHYFWELAQKRLALKKQEELKHGSDTRLDGARNESLPSVEDVA